MQSDSRDDKQDGQNGQKRPVNVKLNTRVVATLVLAIVVIFAGCTGLGEFGGESVAEADTPNDNVGAATTVAAGDGGGTDAGNGSSRGDGNAGSDSTEASSNDGEDADSVDSVFGADPEAEDSWFNLSEPGHYTFVLAGMDEETGEQVTGRLVYDIEAAGGGEVTTSVDYEFGGEQYQSSTTGPADEVSGQLYLTPAYAPVLALQSVSLQYLLEMGFTDPNVGNRKQSTTEEGTQVTEVTEKRTIAGLDCFFVETTLDGKMTQQGCIRGSEGGIAPYAATYTDEGELKLEVELVEYERQ